MLCCCGSTTRDDEEALLAPKPAYGSGSTTTNQRQLNNSDPLPYIVDSLTKNEDRSVRQIDPKRLRIEGTPLYCGEHRFVYKGKLKLSGGASVDVAVKMILQSEGSFADSEVDAFTHLQGCDRVIRFFGIGEGIMLDGNAAAGGDGDGDGDDDDLKPPTHGRPHKKAYSFDTNIKLPLYRIPGSPTSSPRGARYNFMCVELMERTLLDVLNQRLQSAAALAGGDAGERVWGWPQRLRALCDVANGVAQIHDRGFIHRDLKPSNVLVDAGGRCKLADLGLARPIFRRQSAPAPAPAATHPARAQRESKAEEPWMAKALMEEEEEKDDGDRQEDEHERPPSVTGDDDDDNGLPMDASVLGGTPAFMAPECIRRWLAASGDPDDLLLEAAEADQAAADLVNLLLPAGAGEPAPKRGGGGGGSAFAKKAQALPLQSPRLRLNFPDDLRPHVPVIAALEAFYLTHNPEMVKGNPNRPNGVFHAVDFYVRRQMGGGLDGLNEKLWTRYGERLPPQPWVNPNPTRPAHHAADAYAFAIIMWRVMTLRPPWLAAPTPSEIYRLVLRGVRPETSSDEEAAAPQGFVALMRQLWAPEPAQRPPFAHALKKLKAMARASRASSSSLNNSFEHMPRYRASRASR